MTASTRKRLVSFRSLALLVLAAAATAPLSAQNWQLVFSDEFNGAKGAAPDSTKWAFDNQGRPPDGGQNFNCTYGSATPPCDPNNPNVFLDGNGNLVFQARRDASGNITSGRIKTEKTDDTAGLFNFTYGRAEARMQLPTGAGNQGVWPAFWMLGANINQVPWPGCGEIDILEYIGKRNPTQVYSTLHGIDYANSGIGVRATDTATQFSGFHVYGMIWSPNKIEFYLDSPTNIYGTLTPADIPRVGKWPFTGPAFLILNLNMGGPFPGNVDATTTFPQQLLVDYVRVYQAAAPGPPANVSVTAPTTSQTNVTWTASADTTATYNVYRDTRANFARDPNYNLITTNLAGASFKDSGLSPGVKYYYQVTATSAGSGEGVASPQVSITMPTSGPTLNADGIRISSAALAGSGNYVRDTAFSGGFNSSSAGQAIDLSGVTNPAPPEAYITELWGPSSYVIGNLTPGAAYNVRLHFVESSFVAGGRQFNVLMNGQQVLTNFDIFAAAGAKNRAIVKQFAVNASSTGDIVIQLEKGAVDYPEIRALDVTPTTSGLNYGGVGGSTTQLAVNSGGPLQNNFQADLDDGTFGLPTNPFTSGGSVNTTAETISTTGLTNPAPQAVYQTERYGEFGYFFSGLIAKANYTVRLHLAEGVAANASPGARLFHVVVNGKQLVTNLDTFVLAGAIDKAVIKELSAQADEHGFLTVQFFSVADQASIRGIELVPGSAPPPTAIQIDSGGAALGAFIADTDFTGGSTSTHPGTVDTSAVTNPAPQAAYNSQRFGAFTYTIPGLTPGNAYTVRLHFAEVYWTRAGQRVFSVTINGTPVLSNFDIFAATGSSFKAIVKQFSATANASGQVVITFTRSVDNPSIAALEVQ